MNRAMRRALGHKKPKYVDWTCPECGAHYPEIYAQSIEQPFIFCHNGCEEFFDKDGKNVTNKVYPNGKPWEEKGDTTDV